MKVDCFELNLEKNPERIDSDGQYYYLAGEQIQGNFNLSIREQVRIARLSFKMTGLVCTSWQNEFSKIVYKSQELFLEEYRDFTSDLSVHCNDGMEIRRGYYTLHFNIMIPKDSISSIEKGGYGSVKYLIVAALNIPEDDSEITADIKIPVRGYLSLDSPHFQNPVQSVKQIDVPHSSFMCLRKSRHWIKAILAVSSLGLLPGETCTITLTVENIAKKAKLKKHSGEQHHCACVSLCQQIDFRSRAIQSPYNWEKRFITMAVKKYGICKANCKMGPDTRKLLFQIPADLPPTSTKENGLIVCSYFFHIEIEKHMDITVPIVIGSYKTRGEVVEFVE